jgi:hypothetical protein
MKHATLTVAVVFFAGATGPVAWAQEARATMSGRVVDPQNAVVPQAEIVVRSDDTGVEQTTKTNGQGNWTIRFLIPGNYSLRITAPGFKQVERQGIELQTAEGSTRLCGKGRPGEPRQQSGCCDFEGLRGASAFESNTASKCTTRSITGGLQLLTPTPPAPTSAR